MRKIASTAATERAMTSGARREVPFGYAVAVIGAERARRLVGERIAVALAVGGAHERRDDLERPLAVASRLPPEVGEPEVDVELEQIEARGACRHGRQGREPAGRHELA